MSATDESYALTLQGYKNIFKTNKFRLSILWSILVSILRRCNEPKTSRPASFVRAKGKATTQRLIAVVERNEVLH